MVSSINTIMYNLSLLNQRNEKVTYGMSSKEALQYGSDDSTKYNQILSINNNVNSYSSILERIQLSSSYNTVSDTTISNMKTSLDSAKSLVQQALTSTTNSNNKLTIADELESIKNSIYSLANSSVSGQYIYSGKSTTTQPFVKDETTGKISYVATNDNKTVNVETNTYNTQGVNGIELLYYTNQTAQTGEDLTFEENEIILDDDGNQYKLLDVDNDGNYDGLYLNGDSSNTPLSITDNADGTFTFSNTTTTSFESKHSIFDDLDEAINALKQQDSNGNTITEDEANTILSSSLDKLGNAYDTVNITHSKLGTRTASIENYESIVQSKVTNFKILQETLASADLTALAVESQALENTYTALYSTINKVNNLSLVKYLS
ncbi:flagellar hook-associated protein FlgL [Arcobacter sp. L]|uniref:flagellar hook-associated protein FlgL n=1 Tax=Arcobacter sp. L TaxID=944547 RepID=UPI0002295EF5|nr:flagellar hook-associated protein FlgL [Arcobacter sp. L]BAK73380.1 flagellar hook-associated protein FlgL [Arcobacter sp. L]